MRQPYPHIAATFLLLMLTRCTLAQNAVSVRAGLDKQKILIGQPMQLTLEASMPAGTNFSWYPLDSIPHFDWLEKGRVDSATTPEGITYRQIITLTSFDSGHWTIPPMPLVIGNNQYLTDSLPVDISFSKFDPGKDYHDIKDILDVGNPYAKWIPWIVAAFTLLSLGLALFFLLRKKAAKAELAGPAIVLSPYGEALKMLEDLRNQHLPENGKIKEYYTGLNDILRRFVLRRLKIASMVKTNEELIQQLRTLPLNSEQFAQLAEALRISDSVKFAKYLPDERDNERNFRIIQSSVELLNSIEQTSTQPQSIQK